MFSDNVCVLHSSYITPCTQLPLDDVVLLTSMADEYDMPGLMEHCRLVLEEKIGKKVSYNGSSYVLNWALTAQRYGFSKLLSDCEHNIIR